MGKGEDEGGVGKGKEECKREERRKRERMGRREGGGGQSNGEERRRREWGGGRIYYKTDACWESQRKTSTIKNKKRQSSSWSLQ